MVAAPGEGNIIQASYSLLTKVLDPRHVVVLSDWLEFVSYPPAQLVAYVDDNEETRLRLDRLAVTFGVPWVPVRVTPGDDLKHRETKILRRMVDVAAAELVLFTNLDTLPFRSGPENAQWLEEVVRRLKTDPQLAFFSAAGVTFKEDRAEDSGRYLLTQRFSNNCGLIAKETWRRMVDTYDEASLGSLPDVARYHSEWAIEEAVRREKLFGLRMIESLDWRVFHVQQWDERLLRTRDLFRRGVGVSKYLNRVHDETEHPWESHYSYPKPPLWRRLRIRLGRWRRALSMGGRP